MSNDYTVHFLFIVNALVLCVASWDSFCRKRSYSLFWLCSLVYQLLGIFKIHSLLDDFSESTILYGQYMMMLGNSSLFLCILLIEHRFGSKFKIKLNLRSALILEDTRIVKYYKILMIASVTIAYSLLLRNGLSNLLESNWTESRLDEGKDFVISTLMGFLFYPSILVWYHLKDKVLFPVFLSLITISFLAFGSRAMLLTILCAVFYYILFEKGSNFSKLSKFGYLAMCGFIVHTVSRLLRGTGFGLLTGSIGWDVFLESLFQSDTSGGEDEIYKYYTYVLDKNRDVYPYGSGVTLIRLILIFIPRSGLFKLIKPNDITYQIWNDAFYDGLFSQSGYVSALKKIAESSVGGSLHPLFFGDAFCNFGSLGFLIYPIVFGIIFCLTDFYCVHYSKKSALVVNAIFLPCIGSAYLMIARGNIVIGYNYIAYIFPPVIIYFLVMNNVFCDKSKSRRKHGVT